MKVLVIGGIAGGPSFATRLRRINEDDEIVIFERGAAISVASCAMPYYLGGVVNDRSKLIERTPEVLKQRNNIDVRLFNDVTSIDPDQKVVTVKNLKTNAIYQEPYDKLVIATGASPVVPPIRGIETASNAFVLRAITDADKMMDYLDAKHPKTVTILGAGAIGIEVAEAFARRQMDVTIVDQAAQVASPYDPEISDIIQDELIKQGVHVILNNGIKEIRNNGHTLVFQDGSLHQTAMLFLGTGVKPNSELAAKAGITLSADRHVIVDDHLQTNLPDIYAIGDVIETTSMITGKRIPSVLSSPANRQGHLLADIMTGAPVSYKGFIGAGVAKFFDLTASYVGYTESALKQLGITNYKTVFITPYDKAYFFPNADRVNFKLIYEEKTGKILGGQAVGTSGIDKRIAELSVAITGNLTAFDLPALEIPYSPPYSSTRDVLNIAGYVAIRELTNKTKTTKLTAIPAQDRQTAFFLDIREPGTTPAGSITPTVNIPLSQLRDRISEVPKDKKIYITFRKGIGPYNASRILAGKGYDVTTIDES
ncbi:FAD-dependent oxidoreductase [Lentilactobacillus kisonensis]|uniref:Pyridine nucleotide-disulfide oxidoreductase n=1 Tax=Lentilactobacillus kisonensis F0435 TaxID=797516 RepID=H1LJ92_9LACO|nr:FAD-dependent oxidoreductase [Lentilactobacillus kisonensis]EHO48909.1 pyridine nucleotide-disulfide oxidoreductase [Lentilactobacillus kisonensis F0435]